MMNRSSHGPNPPEVPALRVDDVEGFRVVRDDLVLGGTKRRVLDRLLPCIDADEIVYASPVFGFAQIALAASCRASGKRATVFVAERKALHHRTRAALDLGAQVIEVPYGRLSVVNARARDYCERTQAYRLPFGMDFEPFVHALAQVAYDIPGDPPTEVWCVAGSGTLSRALQLAWPHATHHAVRIGAEPLAGGAILHEAPERFEDAARRPPPFPSCTNYDAKAWRFIRAHASPGALFWNVGADPPASL